MLPPSTLPLSWQGKAFGYEEAKPLDMTERTFGYQRRDIGSARVQEFYLQRHTTERGHDSIFTREGSDQSLILSLYLDSPAGRIEANLSFVEPLAPQIRLQRPSTAGPSVPKGSK